MKKLFLVLVLVVALSGCYFWKEVESNEVGVVLNNGVTISDVVGSGRYNNSGWYAGLVVIDVSNITIDWSDISLVTKDKQPISLDLKLTFSRSREDACVRKMYNDFRKESRNAEDLIVLVQSRIPSPAKAMTTKYTLDDMLGIGENSETNRLVVEQFLADALSKEFAEICVVLQNVSIADIGVDQAYLDALSAKAQAQIAVELAKAKTGQLEEQLKQEKAQTEIDLEIARRQNEVNETLAQAFEQSPEFFELEKLKVLANLLDENDLVIYVPEGSDIATVLGTTGVVPVDK